MCQLSKAGAMQPGNGQDAPCTTAGYTSHGPGWFQATWHDCDLSRETQRYLLQASPLGHLDLQPWQACPAPGRMQIMLVSKAIWLAYWQPVRGAHTHQENAGLLRSAETTTSGASSQKHARQQHEHRMRQLSLPCAALYCQRLLFDGTNGNSLPGGLLVCAQNVPGNWCMSQNF